MRILFAHDLPVYKNIDDLNYYSNNINHDFWNRYLDFAEELIVAVRVITEKKVNSFKDYNKVNSKNVGFVDMPNLSLIHKRRENLKIASNKIREALEKVDAVIVRLPSEIGMLTYSLAKKKSIPVAIEMVGCPEDSYKFHGSLLGKVYSPYAKIKYKKILASSTHTLYVTQKYLQNKYPVKGYSSNASNVKLKKHDIKILEERIKKISEQQKVKVYKVGLIGSLNVDYKGIDTAIKAIKELNEKSDFEVRLEVVGGGDSNRWKELAKKIDCESFIIFKGKLASQDVFEWLKNIDIYLQPSKTEGLPRALIESMSMGCPCIATKVGGIPELVEENFLVDVGDYKKISEIVKEFLSDTNLQIEEAKRNYNKSQDYNKDFLEIKRRNFYSKFISDVL